MTRIYISDHGSDKNGLTKQTAIYSKKLFAGHMEITVDNARKRLMREIQRQRLLRNSPASRFRPAPFV